MMGRGVERRLPEGLQLQLDFMPVQEYWREMEMRSRQEMMPMSDPIEEQLVKESSPLCSEIELRRRKTKEEGEKELPRSNSVKEIITEVCVCL